MARSSVDLPEPLLPIRPIASPSYAVKLTPLTACTSRMFGALVRETIRLSAETGVVPPLAPLWIR